MRKYFTWRCIGLHVTAIIVVPACFALGWWQYNCARSGNGLSWAYTFEWPLFGLYGLYTWWQLIHEKSTGIEKLWAARDRTAAAAAGVSPEEIPGWAMDRTLSKLVAAASNTSAGSPALSRAERLEALVAYGRSGSAGSDLVAAVQETPDRALGSRDAPAGPVVPPDDHGDPTRREDLQPAGGHELIDADVVGVTVEDDSELVAYNRYLANLSRNDPPKRW